MNKKSDIYDSFDGENDDVKLPDEEDLEEEEELADDEEEESEGTE